MIPSLDKVSKQRRPIRLHEDLVNAAFQKNPQQIIDIQMNSPGNARIYSGTNSIKSSAMQSPVRQLGTTFDASQWVTQ